MPHHLVCVEKFTLPYLTLPRRLAVRAADFYLTLGWATAYVLYAWAQYAQSGFWPYFFLDLSSWAAVGWYSLLIALFAAVYAMAVGGSALKARCAGLALAGFSSLTPPTHAHRALHFESRGAPVL